MNRKPETAQTGPTAAPVPTALFDGYDTFANARRTPAVIGTAEDPTDLGGGSNLYICVGQEEVMEKIQFLASASSNFGFGGVDARAEFIQSFKITETSIVVLIHAFRQQVLNQETAKLQPGSPADPLQFFKQSGDSYVTSLTQGSSYMALWVFYCSTEEEQTTVKASLSANSISEDGYSSGKAQASLNTVQKDITIESTFNQQVFGANPALPQPGGIVAYAQNFPKLPLDGPITYSFATGTYEDLGQPSFDAIKASRKLFNGGGLENPGIAGYYQILLALDGAVTDIRAVYSTYGYDIENDQALAKRGQAIKDDAQSLYNVIAALEDDPTQTPTGWTPPASVAYGVPKLNVAVQTTGQTGGSSGALFYDINADDVASRVSLSEVDVSGVDHLHWIQTTNVIRDPQTGATLRSYQNSRHGYASGSDGTLKLQNGELVNYVEITASWDESQGHHLVQQLTLKTTLGNSLISHSGLAPVAPPSPYPWTAAANQAFLGFFGAAGEEVNSLGMVVATFSPATWNQPTATTRSTPRNRVTAPQRRAHLNA